MDGLTKDKPSGKLLLGTLLAVILIVALAMNTAPEASSPVSGVSELGAWYSLVPPLLAIILAMLSKRLIFSLLAGVLTAGILAVLPTHGLGALDQAVLAGPGYVFRSVSNFSNLRILFFIVCMLSMISVIVVSGGLQAVVLWLRQFAKGPYSTKLITALMGLVIFIDDYANSIIIGSAMRPVTDQHRISREKLAFLVDSTSAPIAGLAFISSWIGYEVGLFSELSQSLAIEKNGYAIFLDALGFRFYCLFMLAFVLLHIILKRDYGPMLTAENRARRTGAVSHENARLLQGTSFTDQKPAPEAKIHAISAIFPIAALVVCLFSLLFITGQGPDLLAAGAPLFSLDTWQQVITRIPNATILLALSGFTGLFTACLFTRFVSQVSFASIGRAIRAGVQTSMLPLSILVLAWSLKQGVDALHTGQYIVSVAGDVIQPAIFPLMVFAVAAVTGLTTGTSFGTMGIILPVVIPLAYQLDGSLYGPITIISMAAVLDGAIFGDHCSPLSDTTIMSSISTSCDHIHHVKTQLPYAVTVGLIAMFCGYLPTAMGLSNGLALLLGCSAIVLLLLVIGRHVSGGQATPLQAAPADSAAEAKEA